VLSNIYDDLVAEIVDSTVGPLHRDDQIKDLRKVLQAHKNSTKQRTDFVKGIYCAWLDTKNDEELASILLNTTLKTEATKIQ